MPTSGISFITISYNYSYWHVSLFNEFNDKFGKLDKDSWIGMFNVECIIKPSILKVVLFVDTISKTLVFVKLKDMWCTPKLLERLKCKFEGQKNKTRC